MASFIENLVGKTSSGRKELARASLRVRVTQAVLLEMERRGISRADLAKKVGVSRSAITQALSWDTNMSLNRLADIAQALGLTVHLELRPPPAAARPQAASRAAVGRPAPAIVFYDFASRATTAASATRAELVQHLAVAKAKLFPARDHHWISSQPHEALAELFSEYGFKTAGNCQMLQKVDLIDTEQLDEISSSHFAVVGSKDARVTDLESSERVAS